MCLWKKWRSWKDIDLKGCKEFHSGKILISGRNNLITSQLLTAFTITFSQSDSQGWCTSIISCISQQAGSTILRVCLGSWPLIILDKRAQNSFFNTTREYYKFVRRFLIVFIVCNITLSIYRKQIKGMYKQTDSTRDRKREVKREDTKEWLVKTELVDTVQHILRWGCYKWRFRTFRPNSWDARV